MYFDLFKKKELFFHTTFYPFHQFESSNLDIACGDFRSRKIRFQGWFSGLAEILNLWHLERMGVLSFHEMQFGCPCRSFRSRCTHLWKRVNPNLYTVAPGRGRRLRFLNFYEMQHGRCFTGYQGCSIFDFNISTTLSWKLRHSKDQEKRGYIHH